MRKTREFFTLIELLVVIAIIAILAGMLMPALTQARDAAKTSQCLNNHNQISKATMFYRDAFEDFFPWGDYDGSLTGFFWTGTTDTRKTPLKQFFPKDSSCGRWGGMEKYQSTTSRYLCPMVQSGDYATRYGINAHIPHASTVYYSIAVNSRLVHHYDTRQTGATRMTRVRRPSLLVTFGDSVGTGHAKRSWAENLTYALSARHNGAANVVFADGHGGTYRYETSGFVWNPLTD